MKRKRALDTAAEGEGEPEQKRKRKEKEDEGSRAKTSLSASHAGRTPAPTSLYTNDTHHNLRSNPSLPVPAGVPPTRELAPPRALAYSPTSPVYAPT
jgi:hypothetical protein